MNFRQRLGNAAPNRETVLAIGVFDGVHLGHCHLLRRLVQSAQPSCLPAVLTFSNHPVSVLRPGVQVGYITTPEEKVRLLKEQGIELVVCLEFTRELSQVSAMDFVAMLVQELRMRKLVIGPDAALGRDRQGDAAFLREAGLKLGFQVETVEPLTMDGAPVKSRRIREAIVQGDVTACARLLGRPFSLTGKVVHGDQRGRDLGFPTANLDIPPQLMLPGDGIYATWAIVNGVPRPSATSIGVRPTFGLTQRMVEVYIMDFSADLYGQHLSVKFARKLRDQETFPSVESLVAQINRDVANARLVLAGAGGSDRA